LIFSVVVITNHGSLFLNYYVTGEARSSETRIDRSTWCSRMECSLGQHNCESHVSHVMPECANYVTFCLHKL